MIFSPPPVFAGVSCVGESGESANMTECLQWAGPLPPQIRECRVACKDDCTLTAWSKFSGCAGCGSSSRRNRVLTGKVYTFLHRLGDTDITRGSRSLFTSGKVGLLGQAFSTTAPESLTRLPIPRQRNKHLHRLDSSSAAFREHLHQLQDRKKKHIQLAARPQR